jgi:Flp pilus assembly protein CpaB
MQPRKWLGILAVFGCVCVPTSIAWIGVKQEESSATTLAPVKPAEVFVTVLVARRSVPQGTFMKQPDEWFDVKEVPLSKHVVTKIDQLQDRVVGKGIEKGHAVDPSNFLRIGNRLRHTPPKERAVAIKMSQADRLAFLPGSLVDVVLTVKSNSAEEVYSQTILQNILRLNADSVNGTEGVGPWSEMVTLLVSPDEAQTLSLAQKIGTLRLVAPSSK